MSELSRRADDEQRGPGTVVAAETGPFPWKERSLALGP